MRPNARLLLVAALATACRGDAPLAAVDPLVILDVSDGAHGGTAGFFFLPPLAPAPSPAGVFDPARDPAVTVCEWTGTACVFPPVAEFTTTTGAGSERVRAVPEDELYIVNWHAAGLGLGATATYRIAVREGSVELGHVDVTAVGRRTVPVKFRIEDDALDGALAMVVGSSTAAIPRADACGRADGRLCESMIGNVVTDALRAAYEVDFVIINSGALRAPLTCPTTDFPNDFCPAFAPPPFPITRGQILAVLPFGNVAVTLPINGAELKTMLENGVSQMPAANGRFAQVSGLCLTYGISAPAGSRVTSVVRQAADGSCTGAPVDLTAGSTYTIAENDFMVAGGDGYPDFSARALRRAFVDQVVADYVDAHSPITPAIQGRIVCTTAGTPSCPP